MHTGFYFIFFIFFPLSVSLSCLFVFYFLTESTSQAYSIPQAECLGSSKVKRVTVLVKAVKWMKSVRNV